MSLLPHSATFHERVQDLFAAFRGRGVSLSALDVELLEQWAQSGAPFEVVARGIRQAAEGALFDAPEGDRGLRSLVACKRKVEAELKKYAALAAGKSDLLRGGRAAQSARPVPAHVARHGKLHRALKRWAKRSPQFEQPLARLFALPAPVDFDAAQRREQLALAVLLRALPWAQRSPLLQRARLLVHKAPPMSASARRESVRLHRAALLRRELSLPSFG